MTWIIALLSILAILIRPFQWPEWIWAMLGSLLLLLFGCIAFPEVIHAMKEGLDVYFFLVGMMLLSEQCRIEGLFDWVASFAARHAQGSAKKLFFLIYCAGIGVTVFMSNDATAVVMTPAVYAAVKKAGAKPLPYLFACAFIANAASFVLPISNPANLVVFAKHMPKILDWFLIFALPSLASIAVTFFVLAYWFRKPLAEKLSLSVGAAEFQLGACGRFTLVGLILVILVMLSASALGLDLGLPTFLASVLIVTCIALQKKEWPKKIVMDVAWGVIPLVAGLFVIVEAVNQAGAMRFTHQALKNAGDLPQLLGKFVAGFGVGIVSNIFNNLPVGLVSGMAVHHDDVASHVRNAVLVGVDLGPNLSVTGSLATLLWLMVLRREGERTSGLEFFKVGLIAMPLSLLAALLLL